MDNNAGMLIFMIWAIACMIIAARRKTFLGVAATGFMLSWLGMVALGIIVGEHMRSLGGKGLHGMMALYAGWHPCLLGSIIFAGLKIAASHNIKKEEIASAHTTPNKPLHANEGHAAVAAKPSRHEL